MDAIYSFLRSLLFLKSSPNIEPSTSVCDTEKQVFQELVESSQGPGHLAWKLVARSQKSMVLSTLLASLFLATNWISPELLGSLLTEFSNPSQDTKRALFLLIELVSITYVSWFLLNHCFSYSFQLGLEVRALCGRVATHLTLKKAASEKLVSFLNQDLPRIQDAAQCLPLFFLTFSTVIISCILLVSFLGPTGLIGAATLILLGLIAQRISLMGGRATNVTALAAEQRTGLVEYLVSNVESIWLRGWRSDLRLKMSEARRKEVAALKGLYAQVLLLNTVFLSAPLLATLMSLLPILLIKGHLESSVVFPVLMVLGILRSASANLPYVVSSLIQGWDAVKRFKALVPDQSGLSSLSFAMDDLPDLEGKRIVILGPPGSGRSTLLAQLAAQISKDDSLSIAYLEQTPWVFHGTLAENISATSDSDPRRLAEILECVALDLDIQILGSDSNHLIEQNGRNLSGGQKQRIALGRALYANSKYLILDEPLSALDPKVAQHVKRNLLPHFKNRSAIIACSHWDEVCTPDFVIEMDSLRIVRSGTPKDLKLIPSQMSDITTANVDQASLKTSLEPSSTLSNSTTPLTSAKPVSTPSPTSIVDYLKLVGSGKFFLGIAAVMVLREILTMLSDVWITRGASTSAANLGEFLAIYSGLVLGAILLSIFVIHILIRGAIHAAEALHSIVTERIFCNSIRDIRLISNREYLSRLIHDQRIVDHSCGQKMIDFFVAVSGLAGLLSLVMYTVPSLLPLLFIISIGYYRWSQIYRRDARDLSEIASDTAGEVLINAQEFSAGSHWLRHSGGIRHWDETRFSPAMSRFEGVISGAQRLERWFSLRLELLGASIFSAVACVAYWRFQQGVPFSPAFGLALTYSTLMTATLGRVIRNLVELEQDIVSVRKMKAFYKASTPQVSSIQRSKEGSLIFSDVTFSYLKNGPTALRDVNFQVSSGQKVAIVGRTGSGKSTLTNLCLGLYKPNLGTISISGVDVDSISNDEMSNFIYMVPQQPLFLPGRLRDSFSEKGLSPSRILEVLSIFDVAEEVQRLDGGINFEVSSVGAIPLSPGQARMIFMAGAILTSAPILILDEPTQGLGRGESTRFLAKLIAALPTKTVIVITHQQDLVGQFQQVLEMTEGRLSRTKRA